MTQLTIPITPEVLQRVVQLTADATRCGRAVQGVAFAWEKEGLQVILMLDGDTVRTSGAVFVFPEAAPEGAVTH